HLQQEGPLQRLAVCLQPAGRSWRADRGPVPASAAGGNSGSEPATDADSIGIDAGSVYSWNQPDESTAATAAAAPAIAVIKFHGSAQRRRPHRVDEAFHLQIRLANLDVERGTAAAGALHVRVLELKTRALERLDVVDDAPVQVHDGGGVDVDLEAVEFEDLVHHASAVFKLHGVREAGATAADHAHAQTHRDRVLLRHDFFHLRHRIGGKGDGRDFYFGGSSRRCRGRCHLSLLHEENSCDYNRGSLNFSRDRRTEGTQFNSTFNDLDVSGGPGVATFCSPGKMALDGRETGL